MRDGVDFGLEAAVTPEMVDAGVECFFDHPEFGVPLVISRIIPRRG
jgi:hypothetical protein